VVVRVPAPLPRRPPPPNPVEAIPDADPQTVPVK
jgi:hypothetical protein